MLSFLSNLFSSPTKTIAGYQKTIEQIHSFDKEMEKLKEKARAAFEEEARLREQRELDALATMRFVSDVRARARRQAS